MRLREDPCQCGWRFEGFHICVDLSKPEPKLPKIKRQPVKKKPVRDRRSDAIKSTPEWRNNISKAMKEYFEKERVKNKDRDDNIVRFYIEGDTVKELSELFCMRRQTILKILHRARDEGRVTMRPSGRPSGRSARR